MEKKTLSLSFSGLKNIISAFNNEDDHFTFIFGSHPVQMKKFNADFISPLISRLHQIDPTFSKFAYPNFEWINEIFSSNIENLLISLSQGEPVKIDSEECKKLGQISILIDNEEMFDRACQLFETDEQDLDNILKIVNSQRYICQKFDKKTSDFPNSLNVNLEIIFNKIALNFSSVDKNKLKNFPLSVLYNNIISCNQLKIMDEDCLFCFINEVFEINEKDDPEYGIAKFYERVKFQFLSFECKRIFLDQIKNFHLLTQQLWENIQPYLLPVPDEPVEKPENRYLIDADRIEFKGYKTAAFEGIVNKLSIECGGNVSEKGVVAVTSSTKQVLRNRLPKNVVDLNNESSFFVSDGTKSSPWIKYEFKNIRIFPTHYSIRTRPDINENGQHLANWEIQASNENDDDDKCWTVLDSRENVTELNGKGRVVTFKINYELNKIEFYKFLRLKQTGKNTNGDYVLTLSALEFFGYIK